MKRTSKIIECLLGDIEYNEFEIKKIQDKIKFIEQFPSCWEDLKLPEKQSVNIFNSKELNKAVIALAKLIDLRDAYNIDKFSPDWTNGKVKYLIRVHDDKIECCKDYRTHHVIWFETEELRDIFYSYPEIRGLLEIAKPLL